MNITMILDNGFHPDVRVYKEAKYLVSRGIQVTILCWDRDISAKRPLKEIIDGIEIVRFQIPSMYGSGKKQIVAFLKFAYECKKYIKNKSPNYLHCHDKLDTLIGFALHSKKMPYVFDMHEFYEGNYPPKKCFKHDLVEWLIKHSYAALYENDAYLEPAYSKVQDKLYPLKNYPDRVTFNNVSKVESPILRIGYHGVVRGMIKPFTALFESVKGLDNVRVDINGGGIDFPILKKLESNYYNVHINGPYNGIKDSEFLYNNTDILFCGYNRDDPNMQGVAEVVKYFEAIHTGTPMIATKGLAIGNRVEANGFGLAVDTDNSDIIRGAIMKIMKEPELLSKFAKNELKKAHEYCWDEKVIILDSIYRL